MQYNTSEVIIPKMKKTDGRRGETKVALGISTFYFR